MKKQIDSIVKKILGQKSLVQFIKFGLVGVSNTAISYGTEMLLYYVILSEVLWTEKTVIAVTSAIAFFVSVTNSYYWNNRYVFHSTGKKDVRYHLLTYIKTVLCYGVTGLVMAPAMKMWLTDHGVPLWLGSLGTMIITIPLNFILRLEITLLKL